MNYMKEALSEAKIAFDNDEIPVGAVIVKDGKIIAKAHNICEKNNNPLLHAEICAISEATEKLGTKVLNDCEMYVTVEPCPMCAGAIGFSKLKRVYIGCQEPKTGSMGSVINIADFMPWKSEVYFGFCEDESKELMKKFFENKRK